MKSMKKLKVTLTFKICIRLFMFIQLYLESGVDGEGSPTLTLSYTLRLGTKDAGQVDDESVYKAMTAREIA